MSFGIFSIVNTLIPQGRVWMDGGTNFLWTAKTEVHKIQG
jgi:hypothetical protein